MQWPNFSNIFFMTESYYIHIVNECFCKKISLNNCRDQGVTDIQYPVYYPAYFQPTIWSWNTSNKPDVKWVLWFSVCTLYVQCMDPSHLFVLSSPCESQPAVAMVLATTGSVCSNNIHLLWSVLVFELKWLTFYFREPKKLVWGWK